MRWRRTRTAARSAAAGCCPTATSAAWRCVPAWRGQGVGAALLDALVALAGEVGHRRVALNAQTHAMPFYARCGFAPCGAEYEEAGIAHHAMVRILR